MGGDEESGDRKLRPTWSQPLLVSSHDPTNLSGIRKNDSGTMYRPDVFYQGSLMNIPRYRSRGELSITQEERHTWQKPIVDGEEVRTNAESQVFFLKIRIYQLSLSPPHRKL